MFNFLKEKLKSWIKTSEEKLETSKSKDFDSAQKSKISDKKEEVVKTSIKKEKKTKIKKQKPEKQKKKRTEEEKKEEREISGKVIEDIRQEGLEIKPVEEKIKEKLEEERLKEGGEEEKEKKGFFAKIKEKFTISTISVTEDDFEEIFTRLELILLENNTALEVVEKIRQDLKEKLVNREIKENELEKEIIESLKTSIENILIEPENIIEKIRKSKTNEPFVMAFFGINGSGKTTTIAKLAYLLKKNNISCILAACDTFRAAAIDQLEKHGDKLGIKVIKSKYGADPTSVAFDAVKHAKAHGIKAVLIDTAGRMHTKENLVREMEKIVKVIKPNLKIFIAESITGNDLIEQAKTFNEAICLDGAILSKADVDEKGGSTISLSYIINKPIFFLGTGQNYDDLEVFNKKKIIKSLGLD